MEAVADPGMLLDSWGPSAPESTGGDDTAHVLLELPVLALAASFDQWLIKSLLSFWELMKTMCLG